MVAAAEFISSDLGHIPTEWRVAMLGDLCSKIQDGTHFSPVLGGRDYLYVTSKNIRPGRLDLTTADWISAEEHRKIYRRCDTKRGDVLLTKDGANTGNAALNTLDVEVSLLSSVAFLRFNERSDDPRFYLQQLLSDNGQARMRELMSGNAITRLTLQKIRSFKVVVPPFKEQEAIAEALSDADAAIESLDSLIAKKRDVKQATMQQLLTGRTRLPGFNADWKEVRLGECLTIMHGKNQSQIVDPEGRYPILATGGVIGRTNSYLSNKPSVLIGRKGTIDRPQYMDTPFWTVDTLFYSEVKNANSAKFLFNKFLMVNWKKYNEASGVPSLNASTIENVEMMMPPLKEQEAIAEALTVMDDELEALTEQVSKLRMVKEGMMQDLLTGKVRLV